MTPLQLRSLTGDVPVEVRRTHLSEVFLTPDRAFKVKRPVDLGFVDFRDRAARRTACDAEVRLNRRLAPDVYLGVRTLPDGEPVVEMRRLRDEDTLLAHLQRGAVTPGLLQRVAERVARFHAQAETSPDIARHGRPGAVRANAVENLDQSTATVGVALHREVHARLREATTHDATALAETFEARIAAGRVRDTHGDLRLEHVYLEGGDPDRVVVIDCIEFADRFRYADVAADIAFLAMDLAVRGERGLARTLLDAWVAATGDADARAVFPFYLSYRSAVRGKVAGMTLTDPATPADRMRTQLVRARRHWLYALSALHGPGFGPALVAVGGRPGTGKSTLARKLAESHGFEIVRSDVVRRELPEPGARYSDAQRDRVYAACFERAADLLFAGRPVLVDASFTADRWRDQLVDAARQWGVPCVLLRCEAPAEVVRKRITARTGDASEATVDVYEATPWSRKARAAAVTRGVLTGGTVADAVRRAIRALASA
ncbi:MAG: AAA family ATPase [Myxococcota bacterium]